MSARRPQEAAGFWEAVFWRTCQLRAERPALDLETAHELARRQLENQQNLDFGNSAGNPADIHLT